MPQRYVAFLRAINVGGRTVKMDHLRELFSALKLRNVETFIASGNVLFDAPASDVGALEAKIEKHLEKALGYDVPTFLRTPEELRALAEHDAFPDSTGKEHARYVGFLKAKPPAAALASLAALGDPQHLFQVIDREVHWLARVSMADSKISNISFDKALKMPVTFRNITTIRKLAAK
jgi:uncharacterized protein (DUF1697 family)